GYLVTRSPRRRAAEATEARQARAPWRSLGDDQLELDWRLNGKLARICALEDAIGIGRHAPNSAGQWAAEVGRVTERIDGGETITSRQGYDLHAMCDREDIRYHDKSTIRLACLCGNDGFELGPIMNRCGDRLRPE